MRLRALPAVVLVYLASIGCDDLSYTPNLALHDVSTDIDEFSLATGSDNSSTPQPNWTSSFGSTGDSQEGISPQIAPPAECFPAEFVRCPVKNYNSGTECEALIASPCEYQRCLIFDEGPANYAYHTRCINDACPAFAVDLGKAESCYREYVNSLADCLEQFDCSDWPTRCPNAVDSIYRALTMSACLRQ